MMYALSQRCFFKLLSIILIFNLGLFNIANAQSTGTTTTDNLNTADIKSKIEERNNQIKQLEQEINQYNIEVDNASKQGVTLQNTLKTLDLTKKKLSTDISLTDTKIKKTVLTIDQLNSEINESKTSIEIGKTAVVNAIQETRRLEDTNIVQIILSNKNISDIWTQIDNIKQTQNLIRGKSKELVSLVAQMQAKQANLSGQQKSLVNLKQDLNGKKQVILTTAQEKAALLAQTKNKEENFKKLVLTKEQEKAQYEQDLYNFESQLNISIDRGAYPAPSHGILSWPLTIPPSSMKCDSNHKIISCIVRGFVRQVVNSLGKVINLATSHNGVDFRANVGTRVISALGGVVAGSGNTDIYRGCYSMGKWVMVNHDNGLSTIYMHLSVISVTKGQKLNTGDLIGYSGNTGNSEAPHLHVSLYATQGVRIQQFTSSVGCKQAVVPLADLKAYLDPLAYFPN